jgi:hypothetical protein
VRLEGLGQMKNMQWHHRESNLQDLPACSIVPHSSLSLYGDCFEKELGGEGSEATFCAYYTSPVNPPHAFFFLR